MYPLDRRPLVADLTVNPHGSIFLNWTVPIISGIDPDILGYCIMVMDDTSNSDILTECIHATSFTYHLPSRSWCSIYTFTISVANLSGLARVSKTFKGSDVSPKVVGASRTRSAAGFNYSLNMVRVL